MRRPLACLGACLALFACTDGGVVPLDLVLDDHPTLEAHAGFTLSPELETRDAPELEPGAIVHPHLELVDLDLELDEYERDLGLCPYDIEARGLPAIRDDGKVVAVIEAGGLGNAEADVATLYLTQIDVAAEGRHERRSQSRSMLYDRGLDWDAAGEQRCDESLAKIQERVATLNETLDAHSWRPLLPLDVVVDEYDAWLGGIDSDEVLDALAPDARPVQVYYDQGWFIARVAKIAVLQRSKRTAWRQWQDEYSSTNPTVLGLAYDPLTRQALVTLTYANGGCLTDDAVYHGTIQLTPELLEAAALRPTTQYWAVHNQLEAGEY